jgi:hypothetical protein
MRGTVIPVLFALLAVPVTAQTPAPAATPQIQSQPAAPATQPPAKGEDTQRQVPGANANPPANQSQQSSPATTTNPSGAQPGALPPTNLVNDQVAAGTEIRAILDTPLSTRISKPGDRFTATISEPVRGSNGGTVIPGGTRVEGEVAEMEEGKTLPALRDKANLSLRFRDLVLPTGQTLPMTATLISVNNTNGKNTKKADEEAQSGARNRDVAKDVGIGAGTGTIAGPVFGGPLKGLAIGALAGGGYVLSTKGKGVNLPAQTGMVIRLDQPVSSAAPPQ